jgi:uncharacterized protein (DUF4415 family)
MMISHRRLAEKWAFAKRPGLYSPVKCHVTMRLVADVVEWFKERAAKAVGGRVQ